jgi:hypothetical protein
MFTTGPIATHSAHTNRLLLMMELLLLLLLLLLKQLDLRFVVELAVVQGHASVGDGHGRARLVLVIRLA